MIQKIVKLYPVNDTKVRLMAPHTFRETLAKILKRSVSRGEMGGDGLNDLLSPKKPFGFIGNTRVNSTDRYFGIISYHGGDIPHSDVIACRAAQMLCGTYHTPFESVQESVEVDVRQKFFRKYRYFVSGFVAPCAKQQTMRDVKHILSESVAHEFVSEVDRVAGLLQTDVDVEEMDLEVRVMGHKKIPSTKKGNKIIEMSWLTSAIVTTNVRLDGYWQIGGYKKHGCGLLIPQISENWCNCN